jgi:hypothetical protein
MTPAGYLYKFVALRPDWLAAPAVSDLYSISGCISRPFADFIKHWKHNGYWLFDSPAIMEQIATKEGIDLSQAMLFYYDIHDEEFDDRTGLWRKFSPEPSFGTNVQEPRSPRCLGYDVATFWANAGPECSPLSCNSLAETLPVNAHCLFASLEHARQAIDALAFANTEPGPYRIFGVYAADR